jgi:hypothetical protein
MTRVERQVLAAALVTTLAGSATASAQGNVIHPIGAESKRILATGVNESPTLRQLVERIEASDLVVYVVTSPEPGRWRGYTRLISAAGQPRAVMVTLSQALIPRERMAILGHELQHVSEIAAAADVTDQPAMRLLFARIGMVGASQNGYETRAAQDVERRVRQELRVH